MVTIQQNGYDTSGIVDLINKYYSKSRITLNRSLINEDLEKFKRELQEAKGRVHRENVESIIRYLDTLIKCTNSKGEIELNWSANKYGIKCSPLELLHSIPYGIMCTDYIDVGTKSMIQVSYKSVYEGIAYDMMYRDLGETHQSMEDKLSDIGIATVYPISRLLEGLDGESPVAMSQYMKIGDSPYASDNGKLSWDYFYSIVNSGGSFNTGKYRDCVGRSFDITSVIIAKLVLSSLLRVKLKAQLCAVNTDGIYLIVNDSLDKLDSLDLNNLFDTVVIRAFGRKFETKPKVRIF